MMIKIRQHGLSLLCTVMFAVASAPVFSYSCKQVDPPVVPTSTDISVKEIKAVKKKVEAYMEAAEHYVKCSRRAKKVDETIEEMKMVAANYNVLIIMYKDSLSEEDAVQLSGR